MLPIYYINDEWHHKNKCGLELLENAKLWKGENDGIIIVNHIDENINKNYDRVIMGPHIEFNKQLTYCKEYQCEKPLLCNVLSPWLKELFDRYASNPKITYYAIPFPVDVERFCPTEKKKKYFIYIKHVEEERIQQIYQLIESFTSIIGDYECSIFKYGSYQENDYVNYIQSAQFGIWVDAHESQGFALEEALSCNCPLFVYDITSLKDECNDNGNHPWAHMTIDLPATSASYFDDSCGMICREKESLHNRFTSFLQVLPRYTPRQFVLEHLTTKQFMERIQAIFKDTT